MDLPRIDPAKKLGAKDVMIGIPSWRGGIDPETQICLDKLVYHNFRRGVMTPIRKTTGSMIANNRNTVIRAALGSGVGYLLTIDTDMLFDADIVQKMIARMTSENIPILSALAHAKQEPYVPNMYQRDDNWSWAPIMDWEKDQLVKADVVGGAFMMIKLDAIRGLSPPWYADPPVQQHIAWGKLDKILFGKMTDKEIVKYARLAYRSNDGGDAVLGEDYYFCESLKNNGIPIYVDTSLKIGHLGRYNFTYADYANASGRGER